MKSIAFYSAFLLVSLVASQTSGDTPTAKTAITGYDDVRKIIDTNKPYSLKAIAEKSAYLRKDRPAILLHPFNDKMAAGILLDGEDMKFWSSEVEKLKPGESLVVTGEFTFHKIDHTGLPINPAHTPTIQAKARGKYTLSITTHVLEKAPEPPGK